ncbi:putative nucleic acid-binding protein [Neisseria sp. HSC-16F19]|nr:PIN domain nuclease [Neisseria sp. HSC-16F19]MCP2040533.1 putative nucleic acid-binding protein [Neisseria sp. HSC-16F19]
MMIVDTGVWVDYFNGTVNAESDRLDYALEHEQVALTDLILMEILQGFRSDRDHAQALALLSALPCFDTLGREQAVRYAALYRSLRKRGITVRKTNDVIIAGFCIEQDIPLLFRDKDFLPFVQHLGLQRVVAGAAN